MDALEFPESPFSNLIVSFYCDQEATMKN